MIENVIISVYNKKGLGELVNGLSNLNSNVNIISSGGTARKIDDLGYNVTKVADYTGHPESPGGLVKTLHPKIHAGILLDRNKTEENAYLQEHNIKPIDLVACNLYPFIEKPETENIDIGGPTMVRCAAKGALRHGKVAPVVKPQQYDLLLNILSETGGEINHELVEILVPEAFYHTARYEASISHKADDLVGTIKSEENGN